MGSILEELDKTAKERDSLFLRGGGGRYVSVRIERPGKDPEVAEHHEGPLGEELAKLFSEEKTHRPEIEVMKLLVGAKYQLIIAYINYGDQLRAVYRDGVFKHFQEHIEEERAQAYELAKKLTALNEDAPTEHEPIPSIELGNVRDMFQTILELEEKSVALYQKLFELSKDDAALNGLAQSGAQQDQQHADDMIRYLRVQE